MKKILSISLCIAFLFSCSEDTVVASSSSKNLKIESTLKEYNNTLIANSNPNERARFWKVLAVIGADCLGGVVGGAVGSIFGPAGAAAVGGATAAAASKEVSSAMSSNTGNGSGSFEPMHANFNVDYQVPDEYNSFDIGEDHNNFLTYVYYGNTSMDEYMHDNYGAEMAEIYNSDFVQNVNNLIVEISPVYVETEYDYNYLLEGYHNNDLISDNSRMVLSLFMEAFFNTSSDAEITEIISYYSETVLQSDELSYEDKGAIFSALSVARSSSNYWNNPEH